VNQDKMENLVLLDNPVKLDLWDPLDTLEQWVQLDLLGQWDFKENPANLVQLDHKV